MNATRETAVHEPASVPWRVTESYPPGQWLIHEPGNPFPIAYFRSEANARSAAAAVNAVAAGIMQGDATSTGRGGQS